MTIPNNFTSSVLSAATDFFGELSPFVTLIIGVLLAVVVVEILIGILRK